MARTLIAGVLAACLGLGTAAAQDLDQVTVVEALVSRPVVPGPAWWKVSDADSAVYVLVNLWRTPNDFQWDKTALRRRMAKAHTLITPKDISLNPWSITRGLVAANAMYSGGAVEETLSPQGRETFRRVVSQMGVKATAYDGWQPAMAMTSFEGDYLDFRGTTYDGLKRELEKEARAHRVRIQRAATIPIGRMKVERDKFSGRQCMEALLGKLEVRTQAYFRAAGAWARGDVRPIVDDDPVWDMPDDCDEDNGANNFRQLKREMIAEEVRTFEAALRKPGHAIALIDAEELLVRNGVLEQLRAKGYVVATPDLVQD